MMRWTDFDRHTPAIRVLQEEHLIIRADGWERGYPVLPPGGSWYQRAWTWLVASLEGRN